MASSIPVVLAFTVFLCLTTVAALDDCESYTTVTGIFKPSQICRFAEFCCGSCDNRYCCSSIFKKLDEDMCDTADISTVTIAVGAVMMSIFVALIIACCVCPCCCLYKMCRKPRPVTATTTVVTTQYPQQPLQNPSTQFPGYHPVPAQPGFSAHPGYGGQALPPAPYQGQPYAPGPPPPYQESGGYPAPYSQAAYDGAQPPYPLNPPMQPGYAQPPPATDYNAAQPPYNPAYVDLPKTGY